MRAGSRNRLKARTRPELGGARSCALIHSSLAAPGCADEILTCVRSSGRPVSRRRRHTAGYRGAARSGRRPAGAGDALAEAERKLDGALALISGRPLDELDRLFGPLRLRARAVHGAEVRFDPNAAPIPSPADDGAAGVVVDGADGRAQRIPGNVRREQALQLRRPLPPSARSGGLLARGGHAARRGRAARLPSR